MQDRTGYKYTYRTYCPFPTSPCSVFLCILMKIIFFYQYNYNFTQPVINIKLHRAFLNLGYMAPNWLNIYIYNIQFILMLTATVFLFSAINICGWSYKCSNSTRKYLYQRTLNQSQILAWSTTFKTEHIFIPENIKPIVDFSMEHNI